MRRIEARERPVDWEISTMLRPSRWLSKLSITRSPRARESTKSGFPACESNSSAGGADVAAGANLAGFVMDISRNAGQPYGARLSHILYKIKHSGNNTAFNERSVDGEVAHLG